MKEKIKDKKVILFILVLLTISLSFLVCFNHTKRVKNTETSSIEYKDTAPEVLFESIGKYAFASIGSNLVDRGTVRFGCADFIKSTPSGDWYNSIVSDLSSKGITITNMSGSQLVIPSTATIEKAVISFYERDDTGTSSDVFRFLLIRPDHTYSIIRVPKSVATGGRGTFDISEYFPETEEVTTTSEDEVDEETGEPIQITTTQHKDHSGWYYVAFIDNNATPYHQAVWGINFLYRDDSLPESYIKLINVNKSLQNGESTEITFNSKFNLKNNFQLVGTIIGAGHAGWPNYEQDGTHPTTFDKVEALLSDNTYKQLYETSYNGKTVFEGRTNQDFANAIFNTIRSHNINGGEMDMFDETLSRDFFGGKEIKGLKFTKSETYTGTNAYNVGLVGLSQEVERPNLKITNVTTPSKSQFAVGDTITFRDTFINEEEADGTCITAYNSKVYVDIDPTINNITEVSVTVNGNSVEFTKTSSEIRLSNQININCTDTIVISYKGTLSSNANSSNSASKYVVRNYSHVNYSLVNLNELSGDEYTKYNNLRITINKTNTISSTRKYTLTVNHYEKGTTNKITSSTTRTLNYNTEYTTSYYYSPKYTVVNDKPTRYKGRITKNTTVNYYYTVTKYTLTVNHYEYRNGYTTTPVAATTVNSYPYGYRYSLSPSTSIPYKYRFLTANGSRTGTLTKDTTVSFYYELKPSVIRTYYYRIEPSGATTTRQLISPRTETKKYDDIYVFTPVTINGYTFKRITGITNGTRLSKDNYTIYAYYQPNPYTLTVNHYKMEADGTRTTTKLAPSSTSTVYYDDNYSTSQSTQVPSNYTFAASAGNKTGIVRGNTTVNYYYQMKNSNIQTNITKTGPEEITSKDELLSYKISYSALIREYIGNGTLTIVDRLPYEIDTTKSTIANGVYNENNKTITWTININNINSYTNTNSNYNKEINIKLLYKNIDSRTREMTNTVSSSIQLSNNTSNNEIDTKTNIKISGHIHVRYVDTNDKGIKDTKDNTGLVGETFQPEEESIKGYRLVEKPELEEYTYEDEDQTLTYKYERIKIKITTKTKTKGGNIKGDEEVPYGDNSTKNNIIVEADKGYVIDQIFVNGEEIEIEPNLERYVLSEFLELTEDKSIEVSFKVKGEEKMINPETGALVNFVKVIIAGAIVFIIYLIVKKYKNKIIKI